MRALFLVTLTALLIQSGPASAHDTASHDAATGGDERAAVSEARAIAVAADPDDPPVVVVAPGEHVRLVVSGAAGDLHLHGYDIAVTAAQGRPVEIELHAVHPGRFPLMVHEEDALLGARDRALLYLEIRRP